jgi:DNA-binding XRE family transcriptional regulator
MDIDNLVSFEQVLEDQLHDAEFRAEWERLAPARAVANRLIAYRADHGLTQTALGRKLGMPQPAVARLEAGEHLPSLPTLLRLAESLNLEILIIAAPAGRPRPETRTALPHARITEHITTPRGGSLTIAIR